MSRIVEVYEGLLMPIVFFAFAQLKERHPTYP